MLFQVSVVRTAGLEPARPYGLEILSLLRLPFRQVRIGVAGGGVLPAGQGVLLCYGGF